MDIILLEKIDNLGNLGDQVSVKAGYGRNYLIPFNKAVPATAENVSVFESRRAELEAAAVEKLSQAQARAEQMQDITVSIAHKASDEGKLFGSIGTRDIAAAVSNQGIPLEKNEIRMPNGVIRELGEYSLSVHLHTDVITQINVVVVGE